MFCYDSSFSVRLTTFWTTLVHVPFVKIHVLMVRSHFFFFRNTCFHFYVFSHLSICSSIFSSFECKLEQSCKVSYLACKIFIFSFFNFCEVLFRKDAAHHFLYIYKFIESLLRYLLTLHDKKKRNSDPLRNAFSSLLRNSAETDIGSVSQSKNKCKQQDGNVEEWSGGFCSPCLPQMV